MTQLDGLVDVGQHRRSWWSTTCAWWRGSDWIIDIGPGAGEEGGRVVASGPPAEVATAEESRTAPYLARFLRPQLRASTPPDSATRTLAATS